METLIEILPYILCGVPGCVAVLFAKVIIKIEDHRVNKREEQKQFLESL